MKFLAKLSAKNFQRVLYKQYKEYYYDNNVFV